MINLYQHYYNTEVRKVQHFPVEMFLLQRYAIGKQNGGEDDDNIEAAGRAARS